MVMFCKNCGAELSQNAEVCIKCGVLVGDGDKYCQHCGAEPDPKAVVCVKCGRTLKPFKGEKGKVRKNENVRTIREAIRSYYAHYTEFSGRACRAEFWFSYLFNWLILLGMWIMVALLTTIKLQCGWNVDAVIIGVDAIGVVWVVLVNLLPTLAVTVRRLHDTGRSGWWCLISLVPLVGTILLLVWLCQDSEYGTNAYGNNPKLASSRS